MRKCGKCSGEMTQLLTSWVCDSCDRQRVPIQRSQVTTVSVQSSRNIPKFDLYYNGQFLGSDSFSFRLGINGLYTEFIIAEVDWDSDWCGALSKKISEILTAAGV